MSYQDVRDELAGVAVTGILKSYPNYVGTPASTPALVVGLPSSIRPETHGLDLVEIPLEIIVAGGDKPAAEKSILELAKATRDAYRGLTGTTFRSCRWAITTEFQTIALGNHEGLTCSVVLELLVND